MRQRWAVAVLFALPLALNVTVFVGEILGRLDALALSCERHRQRHHREEATTSTTTCSDCLQNEQESSADRILWFFFRKIFHDIDENLLAEYRNIRRYLSLGGILSRFDWLIRCRIVIEQLSVASVAGSFSRSYPQYGDVEDAISYLARFSLPFYSLFTTRDVARVRVIRNMTFEGYSPPPSLEIDRLYVSWRSWKGPIMDVEAIRVRINVVLRIMRDDNIIPHPTVFIGNTSLDDAIDLLPSPPPFPGTYPRVGKINLTDVVICIHRISSSSKEESECSEDDGKCSAEHAAAEQAVHIAEIEVPTDLLDSLLNATVSAGGEGIDLYYFQSFLENTLKQSLILMSETKVRESMEMIGDAVDSLSVIVEKKIHESRNVFASFIADTRKRFSSISDGLHDDFEDKMKSIQHTNMVEAVKVAHGRIATAAGANILIVQNIWKRNVGMLVKKLVAALGGTE